MTTEKEEGYAAAEVLSRDLTMIVSNDTNRITRLSMVNGESYDMPNIDLFMDTLLKAVPTRQIMMARPDLFTIKAGSATERPVKRRKKKKSKRTSGSHSRVAQVERVTSTSVILRYSSAIVFRILWMTKDEGGLTAKDVMDMLPPTCALTKLTSVKYRLQELVKDGFVNKHQPGEHESNVFSVSPLVESICPEMDDILESAAATVLLTLAVTKSKSHDQVQAG